MAQATGSSDLRRALGSQTGCLERVYSLRDGFRQCDLIARRNPDIAKLIFDNRDGFSIIGAIRLHGGDAISVDKDRCAVRRVKCGKAYLRSKQLYNIRGSILGENTA